MRSLRPGDEGRPGSQKLNIVSNKKLRNFLVTGCIKRSFYETSPQTIFQGNSPRAALIRFSQLFRVPALVRGPLAKPGKLRPSSFPAMEDTRKPRNCLGGGGGPLDTEAGTTLLLHYKTDGLMKHKICCGGYRKQAHTCGTLVGNVFPHSKADLHLPLLESRG